jgi:hypothetical protein
MSIYKNDIKYNSYYLSMVYTLSGVYTLPGVIRCW